MILSIGSIVFYPLIASIFIFSGIARYSLEILICTVLIIITCAINIILLKHKKHVWRVSYLGIGLITFLMTFVLYLASGTNWNYKLNVNDIIFIASPIILDALLIIKRVAIKNPSFMDAVETKKANKYILADFIIVFSILTLLLFLMKTLTATALSQDFSMLYNIICIIFGNIMVSGGAVAHAYGVYNYIKTKKKR